MVPFSPLRAEPVPKLLIHKRSISWLIIGSNTVDAGMTSRVPSLSPGGYVRILLDLVMWLAVNGR